jgi:molybdopterin-binding protein
MSEFRIGQAAALLGVSPDTIRRWADAGRLDITRTEGGHRMVDGRGLARLASEGSAVLEPESIVAQSARNRFTGIVTRVIKDEVMAQVDMQAGPFRVVSLMSREAADELGLEPGVLAVAAVKATNVVVELAGP